MVDCDAIIGMNFFHACYALVNCRTRVVKFEFPNKSGLERKNNSSVPKGVSFRTLRQ